MSALLRVIIRGAFACLLLFAVADGAFTFMDVDVESHESGAEGLEIDDEYDLEVITVSASPELMGPLAQDREAAPAFSRWGSERDRDAPPDPPPRA